MMLDRLSPRALFFAALALPLAGCTSSQIDSLQVTPNTLTMGIGAQAQLTATAITDHGNKSPSTQNVTDTVTWSTASIDVATVSSTGVVTATGPGVIQITASTNGFTGLISAAATVTVPNSSTGTGTGPTNSDIKSLTVIPGSQSVEAPGDEATFIAIGTTASGASVSMEGLAIWTSSSTEIANINPQTGVATAVSQGTATITAQFTNTDGTVATGTATFTVTGSGLTNTDITLVTIIPSSQTVASPGETATYTAIGTTGGGLTENLTGLVVWSTSSTQIATINATSGIATAVGQGTTTVEAQFTNPDKTVATGTATFTVTGSGAANNDVTSITILPATQSVPAPGDTANFVAVGTTASGTTVSMQGLATWNSSSLQIATINAQTGLATAVGQGTAAITAQYTNPDKTVATGSASFTVLSGVAEQYTTLTILPGSQSVSASGQSANFIALATSGATGLVEDVTDNPGLQWSSSIPSVATITTGLAAGNGVATGVAVGTTTITALLTNTGGSVLSATATLSTSLTTPPEPILSLTIIPGSISVDDFGLTGQFLAVATYSTAPYVRDVTNSANTTWLSSEPELFPVGTNSGGNPGASAGLVTAEASGGAVIIAETVNPGTTQQPDGTIQSATATFSCPEVLPPPPNSTSQTPGSCYPGEPPAQTLLSTLTVYNEGLNTTNWEVTAPSATGTLDVLHCGPGWTLGGGAGGSVCTATYPIGTVTPAGTSGIVLTAQGGAFGGWSYNCTPSDALGNYLTAPPYWTAAGPNYCVAPVRVIFDGVAVETDTSVGAIFN